MDEKDAFRREVRDSLTRLPAGRIDADSRALVASLTAWAPAQGFEVVLATLPLPEEPDLTPFLAWWLASKRRVALARTGPGRSLDFGFVENMDGPWRTRPLGMREPLESAVAWMPGRPTLVLVPGLAFGPAPQGGALRLGRGAGYYDRWLALYGKAVCSLGVGSSVQSVESVPSEAHDQRLDGWLDPEGFHGFVRA